MAMMTTQSWSWLGFRRRSREGMDVAGRGRQPAVIQRAPGDPMERFIVEQLRTQGAGDRAYLVTTLTGWIARQERSMGGGVLDLVALPDALWREEAIRALARLEGDLIAAPVAGEER
jgi:hypothetical protein